MTIASHQDPEILKKIENFCSYQERCKKEVIDKLFKLTIDQSEIDNIINYLVNRNFIDEQRFALSFTRGKFRIKKWGKIKITLDFDCDFRFDFDFDFDFDPKLFFEGGAGPGIIRLGLPVLA